MEDIDVPFVAKVGGSGGSPWIPHHFTEGLLHDDFLDFTTKLLPLNGIDSATGTVVHFHLVRPKKKKSDQKTF